MAKTLADILIPLAGSISNEKALAMRKACDELEAKVETLKLRVNGLESMVLELKDATKNIALHTDETLRTLAQRVEALEQIRISHEADYSKSASVLADRIEALDRALSAAAEDNGDLDVRVPALERASAKNTGEDASTRKDDGESSDSLGSSSPASPASVPEWFPSDEECWKAYAQECDATERFEMCPDGVDAVRRLIASRAPAAPVRLMRMHCPYCHWAGELRRNIAESDVDAIAHAETCSVHPRRALERRIAELESAPAAPVVDVERVVADAHHAFVTEASFPHIAQAIRAALHAQNVRTVTP